VTPNGKTLYISNQLTPGTLSVLGTRTLALKTTISGIGNSPVTLAITPNGKEVYVTHLAGDTVDVFDIPTGKLLPPITVGTGPVAVAFTPNGKSAYVTNFDIGTVSIIDVATGTAEPTAITVGEGPSGIVILPDGKKAYTLNYFTISVIDLSTNQVTTTINNVGNVQSATVSALTPDGKYLYVPVFDGSSPGTVVVISTETDTVVGTPIPVGKEPLALAIAPSGKRAYVSDYGDNTVTVISMKNSNLLQVIVFRLYVLSYFRSGGVHDATPPGAS
jgi:YVTN family beta-propeller protein